MSMFRKIVKKSDFPIILLLEKFTNVIIYVKFDSMLYSIIFKKSDDRKRSINQN